MHLTVKNKTKKIEAKKYLGQNFLHNATISNKITNCIDYRDACVIEIGPGTGALTREILKTNPKQLLCIEKDSMLIPILKEEFDAASNFTIINDDALHVNLTELAIQHNFEKCHIIGNLPYNVGTTIVLKLLQQLCNIHSLTFMLQKEVVDRLCATPKTKQYGRVSVLTQALCVARKQFDVNRNNFHPIPKVESSVVTLIPRKDQISSTTYHKVDTLCTAIFTHRRKVIYKILHDLQLSEEVLLQHNITKNTRAEELGVQTIIALADRIID